MMNDKNTTQRAGINAWAKFGGYDGDEVVAYVRSDERPGDDWAPYWPATRVQGDTYTPYRQGGEWAELANASMAATANDNFRRR